MPDELRLLIALAVNGLLFWGAYRAVHRLSGRAGWMAVMDTLLLHYLVQYALVCILGLLGVLTAAALYGAGLVIALGLIAAGMPVRRGESRGWADRLVVAGAWFLVGYFAALAYGVGAASPVGDDALVYHLPIPATWLSTHRLSLFTVWFSNPANTYSPLAGEAFIAWLLAPVGNDMLSHFVQMPAMLLLYVASVEALGAVGVPVVLSVIGVLSVVLCQSLVTQSILVKNDLFVAAFFMAIVAGCSRERLQDRIGAWRVGIAAGLFLAMKYTSLQSAPLLLLLVDAPVRAGWSARRWGMAIACTVLLAMPWYVRNVIATGNPIYPVPVTILGVPVFQGLFFPSPSPAFRTFQGVWRSLTFEYQSVWAPLLIIALVGWMIGVILYGRRLRADPLTRMFVLGPLVGGVLFVVASHAPAVRYVYPALVLLMLSPVLVLAKTPKRASIAAIVLLLIYAALSIGDGFSASVLIGGFVLCGFAGAIISTSILGLIDRRAVHPLVVVAVTGVVGAAWIYVYWQSVVNSARANAYLALSQVYPDLAPAWQAAAEQTPPGGLIAYANLTAVRPLMGFDYTHNVTYIPTRPEVASCVDLPQSQVHLIEPQFRPYMANLLTAEPDQGSWLRRLLASGAQTLIVARQPYMQTPPELGFARSDPNTFQPIFENSAACIFRINRPISKQ